MQKSESVLMEVLRLIGKIGIAIVLVIVFVVGAIISAAQNPSKNK
jgi:hypothetical protein